MPGERRPGSPRRRPSGRSSAWGCPGRTARTWWPEGTPGAITISGRLFDGAGDPVPDGLIETWQADPAGRFDHPDDPRGAPAGGTGFRAFGRCPTGPDGSYRIITLRPGALPSPDGGTEAPHLDVSVFARGLLDRVVTRIYFADEAAANAADPVLASVADGPPGHADRRRRARCRGAATASTSGCRATARPSSSMSDPCRRCGWPPPWMTARRARRCWSWATRWAPPGNCGSRNCRTLRKHFRVVDYEHRGHGGSPAPAGSYTIAELGGDVLAAAR